MERTCRKKKTKGDPFEQNEKGERQNRVTLNIKHEKYKKQGKRIRSGPQEKPGRYNLKIQSNGRSTEPLKSQGKQEREEKGGNRKLRVYTVRKT